MPKDVDQEAGNTWDHCILLQKACLLGTAKALRRILNT